MSSKYRHSLVVVGLVAASVGVAADFVGADGHDRGPSDERKVRIGYVIAPVALDTRGKNRALVGLGSYLMNARCV
jgi:hypothetical protein